MRVAGNGTARLPLWFIETEVFSAQWKALGLRIEDLIAAQDSLSRDPTVHPVIAGTSGLRKMRFAPRATGKGKRGGFRIYFSYLPRYSAIILVMVFKKNQKADLAPDEKAEVRQLLKRMEADFARRLG